MICNFYILQLSYLVRGLFSPNAHKYYMYNIKVTLVNLPGVLCLMFCPNAHKYYIYSIMSK